MSTEWNERDRKQIFGQAAQRFPKREKGFISDINRRTVYFDLDARLNNARQQLFPQLRTWGHLLLLKIVLPDHHGRHDHLVHHRDRGHGLSLKVLP